MPTRQIRFVLAGISVVLATAAGAVPAGAAAAELRCPDTLAVTETAVVPAGWSVALVRSEHRFDGIEVYNGTRGGEEYQLAPDDETRRGWLLTQTWQVENYRDMPVFLRCRYRGTAVLPAIDLPAGISRCDLTFEWDEARGVIDPPTVPPAMTCR